MRSGTRNPSQRSLGNLRTRHCRVSGLGARERDSLGNRPRIEWTSQATVEAVKMALWTNTRQRIWSRKFGSFESRVSTWSGDWEADLQATNGAISPTLPSRVRAVRVWLVRLSLFQLLAFFPRCHFVPRDQRCRRRRLKLGLTSLNPKLFSHEGRHLQMHVLFELRKYL